MNENSAIISFNSNTILEASFDEWFKIR